MLLFKMGKRMRKGTVESAERGYYRDNMPKHFLIGAVAPLLLLSVMTVPLSGAENSASSKEVTMGQRIYYFQHRLLPKWTHESNGMFFHDLMNGHFERLIAAAKNIVGEEFAKQIEVQKYAEAGGVLIRFPRPTVAPECFFVYIVKTESGFRFHTYEKTVDLYGSGDKGVVGEWSADGKHLNFGPRKYEDSDSFVSELQSGK